MTTIGDMAFLASGSDGGPGLPPGGCADYYLDGVYMGNTCGGNGPVNSGNSTNDSPAWAFVKTFFTTLPSTARGSCLDVTLNAVKGPLDTARKVAENVNKHAAPLANALSSGSACVAVNLNNMLRSRQLDPFLGPAVAAGATTVAAGLSDLSAGVATAAPYVGAGLAIGAEVIGAIGVGKEAYAAATAKCHP